MRQQLVTGAVGAITVMAITACGGGDTAEQPAAAPAAAPVTVASPATITGYVAFAGTPPAARQIDMRDEPACAEKPLLAADAYDVVVRDGRLRNAFVYISEGVTQRHPAPAEPVLIDQVGCVYHPRVAGAVTGQTITFRNSDGLLHNIKAVPAVNRGFNISQPNNMDTRRSFAQAEVMVPVECNVHGWMRAYIGVLDHPYFAVSGDDGSFIIANLPPGTYTVTAWHERFGTRSRQITVGPDESVELSFTFDASGEQSAVPPGPPVDPHDHAVAVAHQEH
jgi:plastocyanin